ncbi:MAG: AbgT family transporter [Oscillospiraceae bacterium]|nr:AbgT family transporter [Oscillospiraceae bacterium]
MDQKKRQENKAFLSTVERLGNKLPPPLILYFYLCIFVVILSFLGSLLGWNASGELIDTANGSLRQGTVGVTNLLSRYGLVYIIENLVSNFTGYHMMGLTVVILIGLGFAEQSGWMGSLIKRMCSNVPAAFITPVVIFIGIQSNICENAGYYVFVPLAGLIFMECGKHPIAGIAAGFAGVSGGYSANLIIGSIDATLAGLSQTAVDTVAPSYKITPLGNYFFMFFSTFVLVGVGTFIVEKIVIPMLGEWDPDEGDGSLVRVNPVLTAKEIKAMRIANAVFAGIFLLIALSCIPASSPFRNSETGSLLDDSLLIDGIVPIISAAFMVPGLIYGYVSGHFRSSRDAAYCFEHTFEQMAPFLAAAFMGSQFSGLFRESGISTVLALRGAQLLDMINMHWSLLIVLFGLIVAILNLVIPAASVKWAILAPAFIPMFYHLGLSPELVQACYRIADSSMNLICPVMASVPLFIMYMQKYDRKAEFGTLWSMMLPFSLCFFAVWMLLLMVWCLLGLPLGPGVSTFLSQGLL